MNKLYLIIAVTLISLSAAAQRPQDKRPPMAKSQVRTTIMGKWADKKPTKNQLQQMNAKNYKPIGMQTDKQTKALGTADMPTTLIDQQPEGKLYKNTWRTSASVFTSWGYIVPVVVDGLADDLVEAYDGSIYIKDPLTTRITDTWIKGTKGEGDTINVQLPQLIGQYVDVDSTYNYYVWKMVLKEYDIDGELYYDYVPDSVSQTMKFVWRNDSLIKADKEMLGFGDEAGTWQGDGDMAMYISVYGGKTVTPPANATVQTYSLEYPYDDYQDDAIIVNVAKKDNEIYLGGLWSNMPDAWAKGTIDGDKLTFEQQYLGVDSLTMSHVFFAPARLDSVYIEYIEDGEDYSYWDTETALTDKTLFDFDEATGEMHTDSVFVINQGTLITNYMLRFMGATLKPWTETAATPQDPTIDEFEPYSDDGGYGYAVFSIPMTDTDGKVMNTKKLYYNFYFDNELQTLHNDEYMIDDDITDIPFEFTDDYAVFSYLTQKTLYYFSTGFDKFGVQSIYKGGGETHTSNITWYDVETTGLKTINDTADLKRVDYTDLCGRHVSNPTKGVYIKTMTYGNGTTKTLKVVKK